MHRLRSDPEYYLQVVKSKHELQWPKPEDELLVGSQELGDGFTQYWAYEKNSGKDKTELPSAEIVASENPTPKPAILINQTPYSFERLELILVKDGHAWAKTDSSIDNLEDNVASIVNFAKQRFDLDIEYFQTTGSVSPEVDERLNQLESKASAEGENDSVDQEASLDQANIQDEEPQQQVKPSQDSDDRKPFHSRQELAKMHFSGADLYKQDKSFPKLAVILPILVLVLAFLGATSFRGKIFNVLQKLESHLNTSNNAPVTPTPTIAVLPTTAPIDRSQYKVKVLNGTLVSGAAGQLSTKLQDKGWGSAGVGNADSSALAQTQVRVKAGLEEVGKTLAQDLAPDLEASVSADLSQNSSEDAEVIIGNK